MLLLILLPLSRTFLQLSLPSSLIFLFYSNLCLFLMNHCMHLESMLKVWDEILHATQLAPKSNSPIFFAFQLWKKEKNEEEFFFLSIQALYTFGAKNQNALHHSELNFNYALFLTSNFHYVPCSY